MQTSSRARDVEGRAGAPAVLLDGDGPSEDNTRSAGEAPPAAGRQRCATMTEQDGQTHTPAASSGEPCTVAISSEPPDWSGYLARNAQAGIYHDSRWGCIYAEAYGARPFYLTAERAGRTVGALQLIAQKSVLFGSHLCSIPYFDAAGVLADDPAARQALLEAAGGLRADLGVGWVELRQMAPLDAALPARTDKVTMLLKLPQGGKAIWDQLKTKVRTKVRKAQKEELTVLPGRADRLDDFHDIYVRAMRDLGSPPHSRRFFHLILETFGEAPLLFSVRKDEKLLAASFALIDRHGFHVPWSGSDVRFRELGANRQLYWSMLEHAADAGCPIFDFGRSTEGSGTYEFKKEWGAEPVPLYWHYLLAEGAEMPDLRPDSPKYRFLVACWKKLPVGWARALGPRLIAKLT